MKKKMITIVLALLICVSVVAGGTQAYFAGRVTAHNVITTGAVEIILHEQQADGTPYPKEPVPAMPGDIITKKAFVENQEADAFVRAKYTVLVKEANGDALKLDAETLKSLVSVTGTDARWKAGTDGWMYYDEVVKRDAVTGYLLTTVELSGPNITNEFANCSIEVAVQAQAVQAANNGNSAIAAQGWPVS